MKAVRLHAYGDVDQFKHEHVADPTPAAGEVLIKVEASSLNVVELYLHKGFLAQHMPLEHPAILGIDVAGTIAAVGPGVSGFAVGDRVIGKLPINSKGSHADFAVAGPEHLAKLPANVSFLDGSTLPLAGLTGRQAVDALSVRRGDRVLVTGALGAVGRSAVQYLKELGAVPVAGVRAERLTDAKALTGEALVLGGGEKGSFAAAVDTVGGAAATAAIDLVRDRGILAAVAGVPEGANSDARIKVAAIAGKEDSKMLQKIADAASRGDLVIPIARTYSLEELPEAYRHLGLGGVGGKIVIVR